MSVRAELLVNLEGSCVYASSALAILLQCGLHELYGEGWRHRLSPYADTPFDPKRVLDIIKTNAAIHHNSPDGSVALVTRLQTVTAPEDRTQVTGFFGRVQMVRVLRRLRVSA